MSIQTKKENIWAVARKLALRQVQRSNKWMTMLIIAIMTLTFLNLVVITGILVGLTEGLFTDYKEQYTSDVIFSTPMGESAIENTNDVIQMLEKHPDVDAFSVRYIQTATVEANYQTRWNFDEPENSVSTQLTGIEPLIEDNLTNLSKKVVEGEYLNPEESGYVLMGSLMLDEYATFSDTFDPLQNVKPGTRVKLSFVVGSTEDNAAETGHGSSITSDGIDRVNSVSEEFIVKGILDSKVGQVASRAYITQKDWDRLVNKKLQYADEIIVSLHPNVSDIMFVQELQKNGFGKYATIETSAQAVPSTLNDLQKTFRLLGNLMGGIAVIVSSITVFVVIYVNALTRRKHIGVLKGIGINGKSIERAYVMQSLFYATVGISIGFVIIFLFLVPFFMQHPIDFPVSDGILAVTIGGTVLRACILIVITAIAGFIPAWLVVKGNTLDSILGR